ncbi:hypothetical protein VP01_4899g1, partial [Puccinia sorghi]
PPLELARFPQLGDYLHPLNLCTFPSYKSIISVTTVRLLQYLTPNHRLAAIAHWLKSVRSLKDCIISSVDSPCSLGLSGWLELLHAPITAKWLKHKFITGAKQSQDGRLVPTGLVELPNPHVASNVKYTPEFFREKWRDQCNFQQQHMEAEQAKLVAVYKQEAAWELLRCVDASSYIWLMLGSRGCMGQTATVGKIFLATEMKLLHLLASITDNSKKLRQQQDKLTGEDSMRAIFDDSKAELFFQAVHIQSEKQPILDSKNIGALLGTKLKERSFKALKSRMPVVKNLPQGDSHSQAVLGRVPPPGSRNGPSYEVGCDILQQLKNP